MALALSLFDQPEKGLAELELLLRRSRAPPISVVYTYELLRPKEAQSYALDLVRFVSQLADLSEGSSVSESVSMLGEGSFLSEIRHSLTHRYMPSEEIILLARKLVLRDLREKYWKMVYDQIVEEGVYSLSRLEQEHSRIFGVTLQLEPEGLTSHITQDTLVTIKNYQFKKKLPLYLEHLNSK